MSSPKALPVSVIIPCFRCVSTLSRAIDSVILQTQRPAEIILVDDASGDQTATLIQQIKRKYPDLINVVSLNKNVGAASARNTGWEIATQRYVAFLDADDSWHPRKLEIQFEFMNKNPTIALSGHQCIFSEAEKGIPELPSEFNVSQIKAKWLIFKSCFATPTVMVKRDVPFRFKEGQRYAEDLFLWQRLAFSGLKISRLDLPLAYVHKAFFGELGLSARMWEMEKAELNNLLTLYRTNEIGVSLFIISVLFSTAKFIVRLIIKNKK